MITNFLITTTNLRHTFDLSKLIIENVSKTCHSSISASSIFSFGGRTESLTQPWIVGLARPDLTMKFL